MPVFLVFGYLFYAAPYLVVLRDAGLVPALEESYGYAMDGGPYASFAVRYLVAVLLLFLI